MAIPLLDSRAIKRAGIAAIVAVGIGSLFLWAPRGVAPVAPDYRLFRPDGVGPHPAVIFVSGCAGFSPTFAPQAYEHRAERLRQHGYIVVFVDYLGRRGLQNCPAWIRQIDVASEIVEAAQWLKRQSFVDPTRIAAMGWSYGGGAVLDALNAYREEQLNFARAVVFYPDCSRAWPWHVKVPILMLLAGDDNITPIPPCQEIANKSAVPQGTKIVAYPGALHGFDAEGLPARAGYALGTIGYHPAAASAAWKETERFLSATK